MSKFHVLLLALLCVGFTPSCDDDDDLTPVVPPEEQTDPEEDNQNPEGDKDPDGDKEPEVIEAQITLDDATNAKIAVEDKGGAFVVKFTATKAWTAEVTKSATDWLSVTPGAGEAGTAEVQITAAANDKVEGRMGKVTLRCEDKQVDITLTQMQRDALVVAQPAYEVAPEGGEIVIKVGHNVDFAVEITDAWITRTETRAYVEEELKFTVAANEGESARSAKIIFRSEDKQLEQVVTVAQNGTARGEYVEIPDPKFKEYILANYDSDGDGELSYAEAETVYYVEVRTNEIHSVKGIEYMPNIMYLILDGYDGENKIPDGELTEVDISKNTMLNYFECWYNKLTKLDVSHNTDLAILGCWGNQISELDLSNNANLTTLFCQDNLLTALDTSHNRMLKELYCEGNTIGALNLHDNPALEKLWCGRCGLKDLDVTMNTSLTNLRCQENELTQINVSDNVQLIELRCADNRITHLDLKRNIFLSELKCFGNQLTELDLSKNDELSDMFCHENRLQKLDLSANPALIWLRCEQNELKELKLGNKPQLIQLYCQQNQLSSLDISTAPQIGWLNTTENPNLTQLFVGKGFNGSALQEFLIGDNTEVIEK